MENLTAVPADVGRSPIQEVSTVSRTAFILLLALVGGCGQSEIAPTGESSKSSENTVQLEKISAFNFSKAEGIISLDTRIPPRQMRRFDIGLGSVTLETLEMKNDSLIFRYTPEIEGGYTIYECTVPVSASPVTIKVNMTPGETSFDLTKCRVVKTGNLHWHDKGEQFVQP